LKEFDLATTRLKHLETLGCRCHEFIKGRLLQRVSPEISIPERSYKLVSEICGVRRVMFREIYTHGFATATSRWPWHDIQCEEPPCAVISDILTVCDVDGL